MSSIATRLDKLEANQLTGYEAVLRELPDAVLEDVIRTWDLATWGRVLAQAEPADAEKALAAMRRFGPGSPR